MKNISKKVIISGILIFLVLVWLLFFFFKEDEPELVLGEVIRTDIAENIFESGRVSRGNKINLNFNSSGKIQEISVEVGEEVEQGQELASLEAKDIYFQLEEAQASLEASRLDLEKLLEGARIEEIEVAESQVESAEKAFNLAEKNLENGYETALTSLNSAYPQIYNTFDFADYLVDTYLIVYDVDGRRIIKTRDDAEEAEEEMKSILASLTTEDREEVEEAVLKMKGHLENTFNNLDAVRYIINRNEDYEDNVSVSDKSSLDSLRTSVNLALADVTNSQQLITSLKLKSESSKASLTEAEKRLALLTAETKEVDIDLYRSRIKQAEARVKLYENQFKQTKIFSPIKGKVAEINKEIGELVQPVSAGAVIVIIPETSYEIKTDIYEEDIVKMSLGNLVEIELVAFPDKSFKGRVVSINPAEKIIDGVIYYEAVIGFEEVPESIKSGMTADVSITTDFKKDALAVPREAVQRKDDQEIVKVIKDGVIEEREVQVGIRGTDGLVEIISGLEEGEEIILNYV